MPMGSMPQSHFFFPFSALSSCKGEEFVSGEGFVKFLSMAHSWVKDWGWAIADDYMGGAQLGSHQPWLWMPLPLPQTTEEKL